MRLPLREIRRLLTCLCAPTYRLCVTDNFRGRGLMDERGITGRTVTLAVLPAERVVLSIYLSPSCFRQTIMTIVPMTSARSSCRKIKHDRDLIESRLSRNISYASACSSDQYFFKSLTTVL